jgi:catechol 2,3-dioxygenase-like lactoylglutathione lyase family enzyme
MHLEVIDHVQLAMLAGEEDKARAFYSGVIGLPEVTKPPVLAARGGVWFGSGAVKVHLGVEAAFRPAGKAHPAFRVQNLAALADRFRAAGVAISPDTDLPGYSRFSVSDPFGNRLEFLEPHSGRSPA